ncbi:hypothetical protein [Streptomyces antibioticus]|uniref:hypothetical protein n=1 Tax=Streptomyces antibioticus TaxID=1890 RepID=UPI003F456B6F
MSDALDKAEAAVRAAETDTELVRIVAAVLAAQQQASQQPAPVVQQAAPQFDAKKWLVIGGVCIAGGLVASLFAVAIAIGATCATACLLILRSLWSSIQKGK